MNIQKQKQNWGKKGMHWQEAIAKSPYQKAWRKDGEAIILISKDGDCLVKRNRYALPEKIGHEKCYGYRDWQPVLA